MNVVTEIANMRSDLERLQQRIADRQQHYITDDDPVTARMIGRKVELERALAVIESLLKQGRDAWIEGSNAGWKAARGEE